MSNPVVSVSNVIGVPADPALTRRTFTRIDFSEQDFDTYGEGEFDPTYAGISFDPTGKGEQFYLWVPYDDTQGNPVASPFDMVNDEAWNVIKTQRSGFITAVASVMPNLITPSTLLVDNGIYTLDTFIGGQFAFTPPGVEAVEAFNWVIDEAQSVTLGRTTGDIYKYAQVGAFWGAQYTSIKSKDDGDASNNTVIMTLNNPPVAGGPPYPVGAPLYAAPSGDWIPGDGTGLVVGGAFMLMLNVVPIYTGTDDVNNSEDNPWTIDIEFGDLILQLDATGQLTAKYKPGVSTEEDTTVINLTQGKAKQGPPQQQHLETDPYILTVYPVWNGVVVQDGVQSSDASTKVASGYVRKLKEPSILNEPYSTGFDPTAPADVEVGVGVAPEDNVLVNFGTSMTITAKNCRFEVAYLPLFFSPYCWFDEWLIASDDIAGVVDFTYNVYALWTKNGTAAELEPPVVNVSPVAGPVADSSYYYIKWRLQSEPIAGPVTAPRPSRFAGEIFGEILEIQEARAFPIKNGNGSFDISFVGGTAADPAPLANWYDYIQSVNVTVSKDGSNGSITVDKYGFAGQDAATIQDIGAIVLAASGGDGTVAGDIFYGLALGTGEGASPDGATWTIPLVGLEKKMDDIALILAPYLDGELLSNAIDYLCRYAGIVDNQAFANVGPDAPISLQVSEAIESPRYDWKSGTSVRSAMDDVMRTTSHKMVVRDGVAFFYELDPATGLPFVGSLGPDWEPSYPDTRILAVDQTPDFEDLRNEIVVLGLVSVKGGQGAKQEVPEFPRIVTRQNVTVPDIPWAKSVVDNMTGVYEDETQIDEYADTLQGIAQTYEVLGRITIPGNASIKPYDRWGNFVIYSITHNIDLVSKTWTTDLELSSST
jgi:hypothetical protein